jgi:hypothetical protein
MTKVRMLFTVLLALAVGASSATIGHAGGGAGGTGGVTIFQCWDADHGQAPHLVGTAGPAKTVLNVNDQFTNATNEELGKLKMVCSPTSTSITSPSGASFDSSHEFGAHLACYLVDDAHASPPSTVAVGDAFDLSAQGAQTVTVQGSSKLLCVFADKRCVSGGCLSMGGTP